MCKKVFVRDWKRLGEKIGVLEFECWESSEIDYRKVPRWMESRWRCNLFFKRTCVSTHIALMYMLVNLPNSWSLMVDTTTPVEW